MFISLNDNCHPSVLDDAYAVQSASGSICYPWDTTPFEYLEFAKEDLRESDKRSLINSVANSKRAIHSHVDFLLHNCGRCLKRSSFPEKLELLDKLGIIAPKLVKKFNRLRNLMEHEYLSPGETDATEVLEVAELFIEATRAYTRPLPSLMVYKTESDIQTCIVECHWEQRLLKITVDPVMDCGCSACIVEADGDPELWYAWVSRILKDERDNSDPYIKCE